MTEAASTCPHASVILNDTPSGESLFKKYSSVVTWNTYRSHSSRPAKRRKVSRNVSLFICTRSWTVRLPLRRAVTAILHYLGLWRVCIAHTMVVGRKDMCSGIWKWLLTNSVSSLHILLMLALTNCYSCVGVEARTGFLYCSACNDFIYDAELEERYFATILSAEEKLTKFRGTTARS